MNETTHRDAFWNELYTLAENDRDIVVVTADMGAPALDRFRLNLPAQFVNVGIAEQNGVLIAAGLALMGKKPYMYAIAPFVTLRCLEQIRVNCSIMGLPMVLVGVGVGFGYADSGPTHHLIEDLAIMRSLPFVTTYNITDSHMAKKMARISRNAEDTVYLRLERPTWPVVHAATENFTDGITLLRPGNDCLVLATGSMVHMALEVAASLEGEHVSCAVADIYRFPLAAERFFAVAGDQTTIVTLEEHFLPGGMGSMVGELLLDQKKNVRLTRIGIAHEQGYCYDYGGRDVIRNRYALDADTIKQRIRQAVRTRKS